MHLRVEHGQTNSAKKNASKAHRACTTQHEDESPSPLPRKLVAGATSCATVDEAGGVLESVAGSSDVVDLDSGAGEVEAVVTVVVGHGSKPSLPQNLH